MSALKFERRGRREWGGTEEVQKIEMHEKIAAEIQNATNLAFGDDSPRVIA